MKPENNRLCICKVFIDDFPDESTAFIYLENCLKENHPIQLAFVNTHAINLSARNKEYLDILNKTSINFADGIGVWIASNLLYGKGLVNFNGTDFGLSLLKWAAKKRYGVYFLGAELGIAEKARKCLELQIADLNVVGCFHGYFNKQRSEEIIKNINAVGTDILLVCIGCPDQELWISKNLDYLNIKMALGLGAFLDFYSGKVKRAPMWIRRMRMEWVYRFMQEPTRLCQRYMMGNPQFIIRVLKQWFLLNKKHHPI